MLLLANQPIWNGTLYNKRLRNLSRWQHSGTPIGASPPTPRLLNCRGFSNLLSCLLESLDHPHCPRLSTDFWFYQLASWAARCLPLDSEIWKQAHLGLSRNLLDCLSLQYLFLSPQKLFSLELHWNTPFVCTARLQPKTWGEPCVESGTHYFYSFWRLIPQIPPTSAAPNLSVCLLSLRSVLCSAWTQLVFTKSRMSLQEGDWDRHGTHLATVLMPHFQVLKTTASCILLCFIAICAQWEREYDTV